MDKLMKIIITLVSVIIGLGLLGWLGLQIKPKSFSAFPQQTGELGTVPVPDELPAPVKRYYRQVYGDNVPVITSAVISGGATMRVNGITFPGRFRFTHDAGQGYRHYLEATLFGFPLLKINEHYVDGKSRMELPFGVIEDEPKVNQAANLGLWAESIWFPSIFITDPRVHWEEVDEETALLVVPFEGEEERFVVRFTPDTGMLHIIESMRYKGADSEHKTLWLNEAREWNAIGGFMIPSIGAITWFDEGTPWAVFTVDEVVYNMDVEEYIREFGP
jgi:hypothetical protein